MLKTKRVSKARAPALDTRTVLYCDFDGVLHPDEVYSPQSERSPRLEPPGRGHRLFENAPILEAALTDYPKLSLVLSTSWCQQYGLEYATKQLPPALQARVIGTTFDPTYPHFWRMAHWTRYNQIMADVACRNPTQWLALDDVALGWPNAELHRLILTTSRKASPPRWRSRRWGAACKRSLAWWPRTEMTGAGGLGVVEKLRALVTRVGYGEAA